MREFNYFLFAAAILENSVSRPILIQRATSNRHFVWQVPHPNATGNIVHWHTAVGACCVLSQWTRASAKQILPFKTRTPVGFRWNDSPVCLLFQWDSLNFRAGCFRDRLTKMFQINLSEEESSVHKASAAAPTDALFIVHQGNYSTRHQHLHIMLLAVQLSF